MPLPSIPLPPSRPPRAIRAASVALALVLAACGAGAGPLRAQSPPARIPAAELLEDFAVLRDAYETLHPGLYRYADSARVAASFGALREELSRDRTLAEAYLAISVFLAGVRCGHSYANFFNQPEAVAHALLQRDRVPFLFRWIGGRMVVTRNLSGEPRLAPGTEVRSINGVPAADVLRRLMSVARADGSNDAKRVAGMELRGDSRYEAFDVFFPLLFPPPDGPWSFEVAGPAGSPAATVRVRPLAYAERLAATGRAAAARPADDPGWEFRFLDAGTGYLRMPTWSLYNSRWDWKAYLDGVFARLEERGAAALVIDLRGNEGGTGVGDEILARLAARDLRLDAFRRRVRYRAVPERLRPHLDTWDRSFLDWGGQAVPGEGGFYTLTRYNDEPGSSVVRAAARPFRGRAFVLVDASNSSATFEFALSARQNRLATLVGQPTGGNQRGINGGAFFFLRLPRSGIEVDVPLIGYFPPVERPDSGIAPDVLVEPSAEDVARGVDTELRAVLEMIRGSR